jgi:hypothetical protein
MEDWIICLEECLPDFGINLGHDKIEELAKIMQENAACISDMLFEMRGGRSVEAKTDYKTLYEQAKREAAKERHENDVFRGSVARRHNVDISDVRIEHDSVIVHYDL